jgi:hypothetical protein
MFIVAEIPLPVFFLRQEYPKAFKIMFLGLLIDSDLGQGLNCILTIKIVQLGTHSFKC